MITLDDMFRKVVEAYQRLDDQDGLVQYCKDLIEQSSKIEILLDFDVPFHDEINIEEQIYVQMLPEILRTCADGVRPYEVYDQRNFSLRTLGDAHFHWATVLQTDEEYNQAIEHYFKSFMQYKECDNQSEQNVKLINFIDKLKTKESTDVNGLVSEYVSISPIDGTRLWLKVAAGFCRYDLQNDETAAQINNSIAACSNALERLTETEITPLLKAACHYTMLRIYKDLRYADDIGRTFIEQMVKDENYQQSQTHLTKFDQRLLCQWARNFINEYNQRCDDEQIRIPDTLAKQFYLPSIIDAITDINGQSQCLGDILMIFNDHSGALAYWKWIVTECESLFSKLEQQLIYDDDTTISDVLIEIHQLQQNAHEYIRHLSVCYEHLARYNIRAGELPDVSIDTAASYFESAAKACATAIGLRKRIGAFEKTKMNDLQQLMNQIQNKPDTIGSKSKDAKQDYDLYSSDINYGSEIDDID